MEETGSSSNSNAGAGGGEAESSMIVPGAVSTVEATSGSRIMMQPANPFHHPDILDYFFKQYGTFELLRQCRLVCKQWLELSQRPWRSVCPLTLRFDVKGNSPPAILPNVLEFIQNPGNNCDKIPFKILRLYNWENNEHLAGLSNVFEGLRELTLGLRTWRGKVDVEQLREMIFRRCPNLQSLTLQDASFAFRSISYRRSSALDELEREYEYRAPQFGEQTHLKSLTINRGTILEEKVSWMELLSHFPTLSSLNLRQHVLCGELLKVIQLIRRQNPERNLHLTSLNATFICEADDSPGWPCVEVPELKLGIMKELGLPIEKLEIRDIAEVDIRIRDVANEAITYSANHLKELEVTSSPWCRRGRPKMRNENYRHAAWKFPEGAELTKLEKLDIFVPCDSLEFLQSTSNLADLFVREKFGRACSPNVAEELKQRPLLNLTKLYLLEGVEKDDLPRLVDWMPNLERVKMQMDDDELGIVCGGLKKLKYLSVTGQLLSDKGIIENIGLLEGLEKFAFYSKNVTDISVFEGLLQLPKLRKVFRVIEGSDIGKAARKCLKAKARGISRYSVVEKEYQNTWENSGSDDDEDKEDNSEEDSSSSEDRAEWSDSEDDVYE